ncbi:hypothetical protein CYB_1079 [Synechococcus sp. JA-2-3B'a(2-13)]|nr:hypothetical protein CYB_1079 [Synechococcus sp. JA-2-3B'a(2-13)]
MSSYRGCERQESFIGNELREGIPHAKGLRRRGQLALEFIVVSG